MDREAAVRFVRTLVKGDKVLWRSRKGESFGDWAQLTVDSVHEETLYLQTREGVEGADFNPDFVNEPLLHMMIAPVKRVL